MNWKEKVQSRTFWIAVVIVGLVVVGNIWGLIALTIALFRPSDYVELVGKIVGTYLRPVNTLATALLVPYFLGNKAIDGIEKWKAKPAPDPGKAA